MALVLNGTTGIVVADGATIGSSSDTDAITIPSTGRITFNQAILAQAGIQPNSNSFTAAEVLDDYEHGTWTPAVNDGTSSPTYTDAAGFYVKIGDQVFTDFYIRFSGGTTDGNIIRVSGLPFVTSSTFRRGFGTSTYQNVSNKTVTWYATAGTAATQGYADGNDIYYAANGTALSNKYIIGGFTYSVAA